MEFSEDGSELLTASENGAMTVWKLNQELASIDGLLERSCKQLTEYLQYLMSQSESYADQADPAIFDICNEFVTLSENSQGSIQPYVQST